MSDPSVILLIVGIISAAAGFAGLILPLLPGAPLLFAGLFLCAWAERFRYAGFWTLFVLAGMAAATYPVEHIGVALGAKKYGGSGRAMLGAAIGGLLGIFFGVPGILVGPFLGAVAGELSLRRSIEQAGRAGFGTVVGIAMAAGGKLAIGIAMTGLFLAVRLL